MPKINADRRETRPEGSGRLEVRAMQPSISLSSEWLIAPAPPAAR